MRLFGVLLFFVGLVATTVGAFNGVGALFSWNGRHAVDVISLQEGPTTRELIPVPGRRYTVGVHVVFDREGLGSHEGLTVVEAKLPLVLRVKDPAGTTRAEVSGWLDPNERPNVLYGQAAHASPRAPTPELVVERLIGPFTAASDAPLSIYVDIGADRIGTARILARRLVIHDDTFPPNIKNAFIVAGLGLPATLAGIALLVVGWFTRRRAPRKRGGIRGANVV